MQRIAGRRSCASPSSASASFGKIASLTSFGEDANGELYAVGGDSLFDLR